MVDIPEHQMGYLSLKSSALTPVSGKFMQQSYVVQNLRTHYENVTNAKTTINNSCPRTLATNPKIRDQRALAQKKGRTFGTAAARDVGEMEWPHRSTKASTSRCANMALSGDSRPKSSSSGTRASAEYDTAANGYRPPNTQTNFRLSQSYDLTDRQHRRLQERGRKSVGGGGGLSPPPPTDIIDRRSDKFTEAADFQPRVLKSHHAVESRLRQAKCYNPPPPKTSSRQPRRRHSETEPTGRQPRQDPVDVNAIIELRQSYLQQSSGGLGGGGQPPNRMSTSPDKIKWLSDQASAAEVRMRSPNRTPMIGTPTKLSKAFRSTALSETKQRIHNEEEEMDYIQFMGDVVDDIMYRGVVSNRALNQVFEHHIEQNRHHLKSERMREIIAQIRVDLDVPVINNPLNVEETPSYLKEDNINVVVRSYSNTNISNSRLSRKSQHSARSPVFLAQHEQSRDDEPLHYSRLDTTDNRQLLSSRHSAHHIDNATYEPAVTHEHDVVSQRSTGSHRHDGTLVKSAGMREQYLSSPRGVATDLHVQTPTRSPRFEDPAKPSDQLGVEDAAKASSFKVASPHDALTSHEVTPDDVIDGAAGNVGSPRVHHLRDGDAAALAEYTKTMNAESDGDGTAVASSGGHSAASTGGAGELGMTLRPGVFATRLIEAHMDQDPQLQAGGGDLSERTSLRSATLTDVSDSEAGDDEPDMAIPLPAAASPGERV